MVVGRLKLKFIPLEFETPAKDFKQLDGELLKFIPLEFETRYCL